MGTYYTDNYGNQKFRDKRVYTRKQNIAITTFIDKLFKGSKHNQLKWNDLMQYIASSNAEYEEGDIRYFVVKAGYKEGSVFFKMKELDEFVKGYKEKKASSLPDSHYESLENHVIMEGKHKGKRMKYVKDIDSEFYEWYRDNRFEYNKKLAEIPKDIKEIKVVTKELTQEENIEDLTKEEMIVYKSFEMLQSDKIFSTKNTRLVEHFGTKGISEDSLNDILANLMIKRLVVKVGMSTYDSAKNYYAKKHDRYKGTHDAIAYWNKLNEEKKKMHEDIYNYENKFRC